jgi:hypothetical protein
MHARFPSIAKIICIYVALFDTYQIRIGNAENPILYIRYYPDTLIYIYIYSRKYVDRFVWCSFIRVNVIYGK